MERGRWEGQNFKLERRRRRSLASKNMIRQQLPSGAGVDKKGISIVRRKGYVHSLFGPWVTDDGVSTVHTVAVFLNLPSTADPLHTLVIGIHWAQLAVTFDGIFYAVLNTTIYTYLKGVYIKSWQHVSVVYSTIIRPLKKSVQAPKCVLHGIPYSLQITLKQYINYGLMMVEYTAETCCHDLM
jgi:hypothetical protein